MSAHDDEFPVGSTWNTPERRRFQWVLLLFWITYLASSAALFAWLFS